MKNWDDVRYYLAIARSRSVSGAAKELCVSHATVLRRVAAFEDSRGISLFHRSRTGYRVDPRAAALLGAIADVETAVDRVNRLIEGERDALAVNDQWTEYTDCFPLMSKHASDAYGALREFFGDVVPKRIYTDNSPDLITSP